MSKTKEWYMKQQQFEPTGSSHDEDYLYEQYLIQEKLNEEYWQWRNVKENKSEFFSDDVHRDKPHSIFPNEVQYDDEYYKSSYLPSTEDEDENFKQTLKQNGHTT